MNALNLRWQGWESRCTVGAEPTGVVDGLLNAAGLGYTGAHPRRGVLTP